MQSLLSLVTAPERRIFWRGLLALQFLVITWLALTPAPPPAAGLGWDKANHLMAFASLAFTAVWALWPQPSQWPRLGALMLAYGIAIELAQSLMHPREADGVDVLADLIGVLLGLLAAWLTRRLAAARG